MEGKRARTARTVQPTESIKVRGLQQMRGRRCAFEDVCITYVTNTFILTMDQGPSPPYFDNLSLVPIYLTIIIVTAAKVT